MSDVNGRMHQGIAISPSGDVDRDFMRMMIPHHQGAIDMALVLLKYGHDEKLKRLAQSIIVEQGQEIAYMHPPRPAAAPIARYRPHRRQVRRDRSTPGICCSRARSCSRAPRPVPGKRRSRPMRRIFPSARETASTPPSSSPTRFRSSTHPATKISA
jgi:hypothetical protein